MRSCIPAQPRSVPDLADHYCVFPPQPMRIIGIRGIHRELGRDRMRRVSCFRRRSRLVARTGRAGLLARPQRGPLDRGPGGALFEARRVGLQRRRRGGFGMAANSVQRRARDGLREMDLYRCRSGAGACGLIAPKSKKRSLSPRVAIASRAGGCLLMVQWQRAAL